MSIWSFLGKVALFKLLWDFFFKSHKEHDDTSTDFYTNGNVHYDTFNDGINDNPVYRHQDYDMYDDLDDDALWQSDYTDLDYANDEWDDSDIDDIW